jgi:predicted transposase YbfD/YdcC
VSREREILKTGKIHREEIYLITNKNHEELDAENFLELKREYWAIENKLHYRKDFVYGEDRSTIRAKNGPENMSSLRNFAVGLLMANNITNVKRCVDNIKYGSATDFHQSLFQEAA